jgi:arylsulfatase A-like enzyme
MGIQRERPNVVIILSDDHGYGDSSVYGGPNIRTLNIDRIANSGLRFTHFYANSPVCSPSRAALLTGRYPDVVGVPGVMRTHDENSWGYFDPEAITLPEMLRKGGYHATLVGKWHLGLEPENHPCERGFDEFRGFLGDMMDDYYAHRRHGRNYMRHNERVVTPEGHATDIFTEWACDTIRDRSATGDPFFLLLAYNAPHTPIQPPQDWVAKVGRREPEITEQRARYVALVEHMDAGIGRVLDALQESCVDSNTLLVYVSDNGGQLDVGAYNGPLRGAKQDMYEGGIRVPCCAMWPARIPPGQVTDRIAMLMDWFPTACEAANVDVSQEIEGRSILPLLFGDSLDFRDRSYYWVRREGGEWCGHRYLGQAYHAVRRGNMKLLHNDPFAPLEMYDMSKDPMEKYDLSKSDHGEMRELCRFMQRQVLKAGAIRWGKP